MGNEFATTCHRYRFPAGKDTPLVYYDAYSPVDDGCCADVAVVLIHGWGGHVRSALPAFREALGPRPRRRGGRLHRHVALHGIPL